MKKNTKYYRRRDLQPQTMWIIELESSRSMCVKYLIVFNPAALPPHEDRRAITRAHKKHNNILICILIFLKEAVLSDYHLSSVQHQRCSVENYSMALIAQSSDGQWTAQGDNLACQNYLLTGCMVIAAVSAVFIC